MIDFTNPVAAIDLNDHRVRLLRFGPCELDVRSGELRKHGVRVRLREQGFRVLAVLLEHAGETVLREEIRLRLWPNDTVVDFDRGINVVIRHLREVLGETAENPRYIETVGRRGYRFLAGVETVWDAAPDPIPDPSPIHSPLPSPPPGLSTPPLSEESELEGQAVAHYRVLERLGGGGMGVVYRADDLKLHRQVALKFLYDDYGQDPQLLERFRREARAAAALNHPNICTVYEIGEHQGRSFIAMELLEGRTLREHLNGRPLGLKEALELAMQIADALDAAHRRGIIHRDIKPENLFVIGPAGGRPVHAKVLDFGLAKLVRESAAQPAGGVKGGPPELGPAAVLSASSAPLGTLAYMSPEQVRGELVDHRSDIFSFGLIVREMLTGRQTFIGASAEEVMRAVLHDDPPELPQAVPAALERILRRCLEKDRERRFQNAADLHFALGSVQAGRPPAPAPPKRTWGRWAVLASLAVVAGAWWLQARKAAAITPEVSFRRLTNDSGLTTWATISNDGKLVAYASDRDNPTNLNIYVQQAGGGGVVRITDDPADDYDPAFSPDGTQIAFRSDRGGGGIFLVPALRGEARLVVPEGRRPRFSPDGQRLLYWTGPAEPYDVRGSSDTKLWVRAVTGGEPTQIGAGCRLFERTPVWSPDGSRILFIGSCGTDVQDRALEPENYGLSAWIATLDGKPLKRNPELYALWPTIHKIPPIIDQWMPAPSRLLIPIPVGDATSVTAVPVSEDGARISGPPQRLTFAGGTATHVSAAASERMALSAETSESNVWSLPIEGNLATAETARQVTFGPAGEYSPSISRDGLKLAFISDRANGPRLFYKHLAIGREKEVSTEGYRYATPVFNHDGTEILCMQYPHARSWHDFIFEVPLSGGVPRKVWDQANWTWLWDWAPDDATVLYTNGYTAGVMVGARGDVEELDLKSLATTKMMIADPEDIAEVRFSHDGHWVAFARNTRMTFVAKPPHSALFIAPFRKSLVPPGEWIPVSDSGSDFSPHFSYDDRTVFFTSERDGFRCIWGQRLTRDMHPEGRPFPVFHAHERRRPLGSYDWHELGVGPHTIIFQGAELTGNVWLMEPPKNAR